MNSLKFFLTVLLSCLLSSIVIAQDKSQAYYNTHESEILPDAQAAFRNGNYERAAKLCEWHKIMLGDSRADVLREKAQQCEKLTIEMNAFISYGQQDAARDKAKAILALNPDDREAQKYNTQSTDGFSNGHKWVDLGLSVKWATCNVGASSPEEYGDYFAWGETSPKSTYSWSTLRYCSDSSGDSFSKYNTKTNYGRVDNKVRLDLSDDAARANWGGKWRMPTEDEFQELIDNCRAEWTTLNGIYGRKFTSKKAGYTDKWIFLPAAGRRYDSSLSYAGSIGFYWSSSLSTDGPRYAWRLYFGSSDVRTYSYYRCYGRSVRPVSE